MDIFAFLDQFNKQLDSKRREPFAVHGYPLRCLVEPMALLDEFLLADEGLDVAEDAGLGELELLADAEEFGWPLGLFEGPQDLDLVGDGLPVSAVLPIGRRLTDLAPGGTWTDEETELDLEPRDFSSGYLKLGGY